MHWYHVMQHWLAYMTGSENTAGAPPNYNFWSGFGSDLGEATLVAALLGVFKKHNCHTRWCLRFGRHEFYDPKSGIAYNLCRKHHPDHPGSRAVTSQQLIDMAQKELVDGER